MDSFNKKIKKCSTGLLTGGVNGLFGGGGGMIVVPLLKSMHGYGEKQSHATAILIIAPICAASALVYIISGYVDLEILIPAMLGSVLGGAIGAKLLFVMPDLLVKLVFIAVMLAAGIRMLL